MMIELDFFKSPDLLKKEIAQLATPMLKDINSILPAWCRDAGDRFPEKRELIICGSSSREEIRTLAKHFKIVAIVDDELSTNKWPWLFGIPLITTSQWIDMAKRNKNIVSCVLVMTLRAYRHFVKQCVQYSLDYVTPIQILHLLKNAGIQTSSNGLFFRHGMVFFEYALDHK